MTINWATATKIQIYTGWDASTDKTEAINFFHSVNSAIHKK